MALAVGVVLRLYDLPSQILVDDEWHLVHRLRAGASFMSAVGDFGANDHSIGLAGYAWMLMRLVPLNEMLLRLPSAVAGVALLVVVPRLVRRAVDPTAGAIVACLLAISPLLCFFSRVARPYAITTLGVALAVAGYWRWLHSGRRRDAMTYAIAAALVPIFHLPALPAVLAPAAFFVVAKLRAAEELAVSWRQAVSVSAMTLVLMTGALAYPMSASLGTVGARINADIVTLDTLRGVAELFVGTSRWTVVVPMLALGIVGMVTLWSTRSSFATYVSVVAGIQCVAVVLSGASAVHTPIVAARYLGVVLPFLLVLPAVGIARCTLRVATSGSAGATAMILALSGALVLLGPLPSIYASPNDFVNHISYQADYRAGRYFDRFRPYAVPAFYERVRDGFPPGATTIVEAPWYYYFHSYAWYQRLHRQHVLVGFVGTREPGSPRFGEVAREDDGFRFANAVHLSDYEALRARHVRFVVLHRNPLTETRWPTGVEDVPVDMAPWIAEYERRFGAPVFSDEAVVAFDLAPAPDS